MLGSPRCSSKAMGPSKTPPFPTPGPHFQQPALQGRIERSRITGIPGFPGQGIWDSTTRLAQRGSKETFILPKLLWLETAPPEEPVWC